MRKDNRYKGKSSEGGIVEGDTNKGKRTKRSFYNMSELSMVNELKL